MKNTEYTIREVSYWEIDGSHNLYIDINLNGEDGEDFDLILNLEEREDGSFRIAECGDSVDLYGSFDVNTLFAEYFEENDVVDNREEILEAIKEEMENVI